MHTYSQSPCIWMYTITWGEYFTLVSKAEGYTTRISLELFSHDTHNLFFKKSCHFISKFCFSKYNKNGGVINPQHK